MTLLMFKVLFLVLLPACTATKIGAKETWCPGQLCCCSSDLAMISGVKVKKLLFQTEPQKKTMFANGDFNHTKVLSTGHEINSEALCDHMHNNTQHKSTCTMDETKITREDGDPWSSQRWEAGIPRNDTQHNRWNIITITCIMFFKAKCSSPVDPTSPSLLGPLAFIPWGPLRRTINPHCELTRSDWKSHQWEFQEPEIEVLYHIRPYFAGISGIFPYIALT